MRVYDTHCIYIKPFIVASRGIRHKEIHGGKQGVCLSCLAPSHHPIFLQHSEDAKKQGHMPEPNRTLPGESKELPGESKVNSGCLHMR